MTTKTKSNKPVSYKGYKILEETDRLGGQVFNVYTAGEWAQGKGYRQVEWEAGTLEEAKEWIG